MNVEIINTVLAVAVGMLFAIIMCLCKYVKHTYGDWSALYTENRDLKTAHKIIDADNTRLSSENLKLLRDLADLDNKYQSLSLTFATLRGHVKELRNRTNEIYNGAIGAEWINTKDKS